MADLLLDIQPSKLDFFIELIQNFKFIKIKSIPVVDSDGDTREEIISNIKESVTEYKLVLQGKAKARPVEQLLKELRELQH